MLLCLTLLRYAIVIVTSEMQAKSSNPLECTKRFHVTGSTSYYLMNSHLVCHIGPYRQDSKETVVKKVREGQYTKVIRGSTKNISCGIFPGGLKTLQDDTLRLMIVPRNMAERPITEFNLKTRQQKPYRYLTTVRHMTAIVYMANSKKLLFASEKNVMSAYLDIYGVTVLKKNVDLCRAITVDETKRLVFMSIRGGRDKIGRLTTQGHGYKTIGTSKPVYSMSVDSKKQHLFICTYTQIRLMSYEGKQTTLIERKQGSAMTFDPENSVLYYSHKHSVMKLSLSSVDTPLPMGVYLDRPINFVYSKGNVYINELGLGLTRWSIHTNVVKSLLRSQYLSLLCLLY